ncbi:hypothetical protein [Sporosarcina sp. G11-34]|uniref:hypothetical protein n=1 Tax=Sporosarcina sp. G11-34 TaxID=2849605 RepID=UPI0022A91BA5|nr:hypothetical protein [Sporosarcina sp. G11-34]MCZ2259565.1 hypothetical protein [Sporosarcina sp. G11-34]
MSGWLNLGSLALGLIAWILPIISLMRYVRQDQRKLVVLTFMSFSACAISLIFQIFYHYHLVKIEDWSALMDTMGGVAFASAMLLIVTIILNTIILILYSGRAAK